MEKIIDILKSRWLKNTGKTVMLMAIIIALFIGANIALQKWDPKDIDLTSEKLYSLTDDSKEKIKSLPAEDKIQIYMFGYDENNVVVDFIKEYGRITDSITVEVLKREDRPDLVGKYNIEDGASTVLIVNGEKSKTFISAEYYSDFFTYDYTSQEQIDITEERMTNGIIALSSIGENTPVYMLTGHNEYSIAREMAALQSFLDLENYEIRNLDLLSEQHVPEDCTSLVIASPKKDFTEFEANALKEYIERGGNIVWLTDPYSAEGEIPNIKSVLDVYGVNIRQDGIVVEQDTSNMIMGSADMIIPMINGSDITNGLNKVLLIDAGKLEFKEDLSEINVVKTDLLVTGERSFFRTNLQETSYTPVEGEQEGSSVVAAQLEKSFGEEEDAKKSKLIVFANNIFATNSAITTGQSSIAAIGFYDNKDLILNAIENVSPEKTAMAIRKQVKYTSYTATETQNIIIRTIIFALPVIIIIARNSSLASKKKKKIIIKMDKPSYAKHMRGFLWGF